MANVVNFRNRYIIFIIIQLIVSPVLFAEPITVLSHKISALRQSELRDLLLQDCGSCHGMTLKGGIGPALTVEALKNKSRQMVELTILQGRPGTPMPPWKNILTTEEVKWLVDSLYSGIKP